MKFNVRGGGMKLEQYIDVMVEFASKAASTVILPVDFCEHHLIFEQVVAADKAND